MKYPKNRKRLEFEIWKRIMFTMEEMHGYTLGQRAFVSASLIKDLIQNNYRRRRK